MAEMNLEVGQKWKSPSGVFTREILAVSELAVAYRFEDGMNAVSLHALTPERFAQHIEGWELIHPKPVPEGWARCGPVGIETIDGLVGLFRSGAQIKVNAPRTDGILRVLDPENLKAAIDYVMETGEA